jgi:glycosyltransferase involved in cell wall biosynthesis
MRVLIIEPAGNLWGSERAMLDLVDYLDDAELAVCMPPSRPLRPELDRRGIRVLPYYVYALHEKTKLQRLYAAFGVFLSAIRFRPDVIYMNQSGAYKIVRPTAVVLNLPIIAHIRIFDDVEYIARQRPTPWVLRGMVSISSAVADEIRSYAALSEIPARMIFDAYAFHTNGASGAAIERKKNLIVCTGRIVPNKGQGVLIKAMAIVNSTRPNIECHIAGDDRSEFAGALKKKVAAGPEASRIQWLGIVKDILPVVRSASIMVAPSYHEALGRVIFEAWEAGAVPVVFAGSGGAAEVVGAAAGGILYPEQTPECLAAALIRTLDLDSSERERLVRNGREWMAKHCDPRQYARHMATIFQDALKESA